MGSDGESDQASGTSSDEIQSPTGVCLRNRVHRRISMEVRHILAPYLDSSLQPLSSPRPLAHSLMGDLIRFEDSAPAALSASLY